MLLQGKADEVELDDVTGTIWEWFWDINRGRQAGMNGWLAIPATEMRAWSQNTGNSPRSEEWAILRDMDQAFLTEAAKKPEDRVAKPELTAETFDAWFG